ncbi:hypothetical protein L5B97_10785 [Avibacterium sp. 20-15]|uniref:factor H binding protein domain-containing protein n=1 Tax=unclassified Avibacterium TaxID=2685287 RepID=UPI002026AEE9|nr:MULTISPECIES: factor H binding protein domain-containing protein [unclassified Avibacterium]MCW9733939.1 hypothetical protein [Avibacterium sp. 20-15]URL03906.1 hypothetical protein L4F93_10150 [Avibacterium sp. 20-132]
MQPNLKTTALALLISLSAVACGSSGSGSSNTGNTTNSTISKNTEEVRKAEEARKTEETRKAEEASKAEETRKAEEASKAEEDYLAKETYKKDTLPDEFKDFEDFSIAKPDINELHKVNNQTYIQNRAQFVGEMILKDADNTKITNENALFLPLDISANGYRTDKVYKDDGQYQLQKVKLIEKVKDTVDDRGKPLQIRISQKSYNLEDAGIAMRHWAYIGYRKSDDEYILSYGGVPTLDKTLETISGQAEYTGRALGGGQDVVLNVNFDDKTIEGEIGYDHYSSFARTIKLEKGTIQTENNKITFSGKTKGNFGDEAGEYKGVFMGQNAHQLAGEGNVANSKFVFVAEKEAN